MEPTSAHRRAARARSRTLRSIEDVPGHVIPILEREFDDFDNEAEKFLDGQTEEVDFIGFRLKQGVYGQRQADVQMIRMKLPVGRHQPGADGGLRQRRREVRAAQQGPHHHAPEHPDPPRAAARRRRPDPRDLRRRALLPRGLRQHRAQRDRRPVGRRVRGRAVRRDALRGRLRALLRAPPRPRSSCRARSRPRSRRPTRTAPSPASTTSPTSRASATACAEWRSRWAAAPRSCRA